ncbi:MAG TPA: radical SAM protein [Pyrinomonadaceae bacterium]
MGEIKATILERDGKIMMVKDCRFHGHLEDVIAIDPAFFKHIEEVFPGRDIRSHCDEQLHDHGNSSIQYGRGAVLTIDLTNRCNMMCDPCFMDANQVGFVHELSWAEIKEILDNAISIKPRRQMSVQFSGGEPTMSPHFLDSIKYARELGYDSVQAATNGIDFAKNPHLAKAAAEAGLRFAYLQFDGIGNAANSHRGVANLFDVKLRAIENLHAAGVNIVPVVTIINGVNNQQVGRVIEFALDNPTKISLVAFQPVSFTGRDEKITDERRYAQRYTLSHLAHDVKNQTGIGEPSRDWFPISFLSTFSDCCDLIHGPNAVWGTLSCGCHPNCGTWMALIVDKKTKEAVPVTSFVRAEQLARDIAQINDAGRGPILSMIALALALVRNYDSLRAPSQFRMIDMIRAVNRNVRAGNKKNVIPGEKNFIARNLRKRSNRWGLFFIAGMWFQDLFNYDFRRTEMCIIPYGTQEGEISFCAYNTGVGWRQIIEKIHMTATLTKWYGEHGRHQIFAAGKNVPLASTEHSLNVNLEAADAPAQVDLDQFGIPKTAHVEKINARNAQARMGNGRVEHPEARTEENAYQEQMTRLYRQHILRQQPTVQIQSLRKKNGQD